MEIFFHSLCSFSALFCSGCSETLVGRLSAARPFVGLCFFALLLEISHKEIKVLDVPHKKTITRQLIDDDLELLRGSTGTTPEAGSRRGVGAVRLLVKAARQETLTGKLPDSSAAFRPS